MCLWDARKKKTLRGTIEMSNMILKGKWLCNMLKCFV